MSRKLLLFLGLLVVALLPASCTWLTDAGTLPANTVTEQAGRDSDEAENSGDEVTLRLGLLIAGDELNSDLTDVDRGIELALSQVDNRVSGIDIQIIRPDAGTEVARPLSAATMAEHLISHDDVHAVIGGLAYQSAIPVAAVAEAAATPFIVVTENFGSDMEDFKFVFFTAASEQQQASALAYYAYVELDAGTAAIIYDITSAHSHRLMEAFRSTFQQRGGLVTHLVALTGGQEQSPAVVEEALSNMMVNPPDVLYLPLPVETATPIINMVRAVGISSLPLGTWAWDTQPVAGLSGGITNPGQALSSAHFHPERPSPATQEFVTAYKEMYGTDPSAAAALAYDAVSRLLWALEGALAADQLDLMDTASARLQLQALLQQPGEYTGVTGRWQSTGFDSLQKSVLFVRYQFGSSQGQFIGETMP